MELITAARGKPLGFVGRWRSRGDGEAGMPVPGYGDTGHGLTGAAEGCWVVFWVLGNAGGSLAYGDGSASGMLVCWLGSHWTRLSIP